MKHLKSFKDNTFKIEDVDDLLIDMKDDFGLSNDIRFIPHKDDNGKEVLYKLYITSPTSIETEDSNNPWGGTKCITHINPIRWRIIYPYLDEFIDRIAEMGMELKKCMVLEKVNTPGRGANWTPKTHITLPDISDIYQISWITLTFLPRKDLTLFQKFKNLF